jgi:hypothetical protein
LSVGAALGWGRGLPSFLSTFVSVPMLSSVTLKQLLRDT